jgi:cell shape-determining protein MreD
MNWPDTLFVVIAAYLAVFWQASFDAFRWLTGTQLDMLPAILVYTSLKGHWTQIGVLAVLGGTWLDSLSANPLGVSMLPLFAVGIALHSFRELILKDQLTAQFMLGLATSALIPVLTLLLLLSSGNHPLLGWGSLWQWLVLSAAGAAVTPIWFGLFDWLHATFAHSRAQSSSFRPDREIRRGR